MNEEREGDVFPDDPDVRRVTTSAVKTLHPEKLFCIGCPLDLLMDDPNDDSMCMTNPCGNGFVWYGAHIAAVNLVRSRHDQA